MAALKDERYLDGLLHCLDCAYDNPGSDHPRCNGCTCGSLWEAKSKPTETWKYVAAICVRPGVLHHVWRDVIGKQRHGEHSSCMGFLCVVRAARTRQWDELFSIGTYEFEHERQLWVRISSICCIDRQTGAELEWCPESFPATVEVLDPGGPEYLRRNGGDK